MIAKPTTRQQARQNAVMAAENAHFAAEEQETGPEHATSWADVSQAWSAIAQTFPYDESDDRMLDILTPSERETMDRLREGSLTTVHPDYILEHMDLIRRQFNVNPGYVGMAVTPEEQRAVMAMRSGERPEETTQTLPVVSPGSEQVRVDRDFYLILSAIAMLTLRSNLADDGVGTVHPQDVEEVKTKLIVVSRDDPPFSNAPTPWKVWLEEPGA